MKQTTTKNTAALKHRINMNTVEKIQRSLEAAGADFSAQEFKKFTTGLKDLELKDRVRKIANALAAALPANYKQAVKALDQSIRNSDLSGFELWPHTEFVRSYGLEHRDLSLQILSQWTSRFTAEFAVRPFLRLHGPETLAFLVKCSKSKDHHVRRWASEGTRPRLPWGEKLEAHIKKPSASYSILENLKYDDELYVRKSVANHVNDISKDHPKEAFELIAKWLREARTEDQKIKIDWIARHGLRTLLKKGDAQALRLIGSKPSKHLKIRNVEMVGSRLKLGDHFSFRVEIENTGAKSEQVSLDYVIYFLTQTGRHSEKVFRLRTVNIGPKDRLAFTKKHRMKHMSTRRLVAGRHFFQIQCNGERTSRRSWTLYL